MKFKTILSGFFVSAFALLFTSAPAFAVSNYTLFGDATEVAGGNPGQAIQIRSDASIAPSYGGVTLALPSPIAWTDLATLSTDFNVTNDSCGGGSPRVQVRVDTNNDGTSDGSVRIALGPSPNFIGCVTGWQNSGSLVGNTDAGRYDYSVFGGSPFTTYSNAPASVMAGEVVGVVVVVDGSWSTAATGGDSEQTVLVDNTVVNGNVFGYEVVSEPPVIVSPEDCKKEGWKTLLGGDFKNQGQCVSYFQKSSKDVSTYSLNSADPAGIDVNTTAGQVYRVKVSGTWTNRSGEVVDAECTNWNNQGWKNEVNGGYSSDLLDVQVNQTSINWGKCNDENTYKTWVVGDGQPLNFRVFDGDTTTNIQNPAWFDDNNGSLTVSISTL